ncbi:phytanoyl-CoA dioxygenase [Aquimarina aquimarini]|uniref:phytanoyl-CoA dioxygenase n=1 Tax=Aquimarina aquimarini TaxID=1191734 RepID=UPI000D55E2E4|nr:phytanoyl-CoA dioxygenase [Aquimarina aquimarini]
MTGKETFGDLKKLAVSLLENPYNQTEIERIIDQIHVHFQEITKITGFDLNIEHLAAVPTAKGKALGLNYAAQCLLDYKRTTRFLKAIVYAIRDKQKVYPNELIHVFYAGCGPYAPFVTLVAHFFKPEEVNFSLLDINKNALESSKNLISTLGLEDYIQEFYLADAVTFKVPNPNTFHILISETLDALLYRECYVPIVFNLLPQFNKNITLIPENVQINLKLLAKPNKDSDCLEEDAGTILDVRKAISSYTGDSNILSQLPEKIVNLKSMNIDRYKSTLIETQVHIYNDIWLYRNESSLTLPLEIMLEQPFLKSSIVFTYHLEPEVELKCRFQ